MEQKCDAMNVKYKQLVLRRGDLKILASLSMPSIMGLEEKDVINSFLDCKDAFNHVIHDVIQEQCESCDFILGFPSSLPFLEGIIAKLVKHS